LELLSMTIRASFLPYPCRRQMELVRTVMLLMDEGLLSDGERVVSLLINGHWRIERKQKISHEIVITVIIIL
jgi:hypothetical protein